MPYPVGPDGGFRPFTSDEVRAFELRTTDVKNGTHPSITLEPTGGASVRRSFVCKWSKRDDVIAYFLGAAGVVAGGGAMSLTRAMPLAPLAGMHWANYRAMAFENLEGAGSCGKDDANGVPSYQKARFTVRFEQVFYKPQEDGVEEYDRYVEIMPSTTETNYLTMPGSMLKYRTVPGGAAIPNKAPIPFNIGRPESTSKIGFKWWRIPQTAWQISSPLYRRVKGDPDTGKRSCIGTVNKTLFKGRPPGVLLLVGVDEEIVPDLVSGEFCFNLIYQMLEKNSGDVLGRGSGWNYLFFAAPPVGGLGVSSNGYYLASSLDAIPLAGGGFTDDTWQANGSLTPGRYLYDETEFADLFEIGNV